MKIERITIRNFGRLADFELCLADGINVLEGANESGKSTIAAFIRFIFYGLSGKADTELSPREKYLSWSKGEAAGSLTLRTEKGQFRVERAIVRNARGTSEHLTVVDLASGAILKNADPCTMFLGGAPEEVFCRTAFVGQADGSSIEGKKISEAIENILSSADESVNTKKAVKKLDDARVMLLYKNKKGGKIYELENERDDLIARARRAEDDCRLMEEKKKLLTDTHATLAKNEEQLRILEEKLAYTDACRRLQQIEKSKRAEEELKNAAESLDETAASLIHGNFCPDAAYLHSLETIGKQLVQIADEKKKIRSKIEQLQTESESQSTDRTDENLSNNLCVRRLKADRLRLGAYAALLGAVTLFIIFGVVLGKFLPASILAALCVAISAVLFVCQSKAQSAYRATLAELGVENETELLTISAARNARKEAAQASLAALEEEYKAVQTAENAMMKDAVALAAKWGKPLASLAAMAGLIREAEDACRRLDEAVRTKEHCTLAYKNLYTVSTESEIANLSEILQNGGTELGGEEYTKACNNRKFYRQTIDLLTKRARETEHLLIEMRARTEIPQDLRDKAALLEKRIDALRFRHDAYLLAGKKLAEASALLRSRITPALSGEASSFMQHATEGKYSSVGVSDTFELSYSDGNTTRSTEFLSCGTKDLAYLGLRLGLVKTLFPDGAPPLVFDESFARLDDRRLAMVFTYLSRYTETGAQALIMTSGRRERKYAEAMGNCHLYQL